MNNTEIIEKLCEKFGTTMEYLVPKAQAYGIWTSLAGLVGSTITIVLSVMWLKRCQKKVKGDWLWDLSDLDAIVAILAGIAIVVSGIGMVFAVAEIIKWITVPEIAFIEMIVGGGIN